MQASTQGASGRRGTGNAAVHGLHDNLKLPDEAIAQIAADTRNARSDQFGVRQLELFHNADGKVYCLLDGPDEEAIRQHHAALGVPCGQVHMVEKVT